MGISGDNDRVLIKSQRQYKYTSIYLQMICNYDFFTCNYNFKQSTIPVSLIGLS